MIAPPPHPRHPRPPIKGALPRPHLSHHLAPPSPLSLPTPLAHPINAGAAPISRSEPPYRSSPSTIAATPRLADGTRSFLVLDNDASTQAAGTSMEMEPFVQTEVYQLRNSGDMIFERDMHALSEFLGRSPPEFYGGQVNDQPGGQLQWVIMADLPGKPESPMFGKIQFSLRENTWADGLARALQEGLARLCGQNAMALQGGRFAHLARHNSLGVPLNLPFHPVLRHHVDHLDFMLCETRTELDNSRGLANYAYAQMVQKDETIKVIAKERRTLRRVNAKQDYTINRLRAKIVALKETIRTQEDQLQALEGEGEGEDIQGDGYSYVSNDNDYEEDDDLDFYPVEDEVVPITVDGE
ncbi:hypothetical protein QYE76_041748 [Lolium multiflorum]|uniref:Uncharacterized protein n=1 Tax=Lolium multiflorum TaxID=4521 RepID=A0AAD8TDL6_LOLMU|nr:hypothetical protein QYE76_041748 [Lolium multiflorum]